MSLEELLKETDQKARTLVDRANALEQERQQVLQEALRVDGEMRVLRQLIKEQGNPE